MCEPSCSRHSVAAPTSPEARLDEQLEPPLLDPLSRARSDRLAGEDHPFVRRAHVGEVDTETCGGLFDHHDERAGERVPAGRSQLAAEAEDLLDVGRLVVDEHGSRADPADRVVDAGAAEREQAVQEVVAGPAAELPELAHEHARPAARVRRGGGIAGRARGREDGREDPLHRRVARIEAEETAVRIRMPIAVGADRVLVDERDPLVVVGHRRDVGGCDARRIPCLADQARPLVRPRDQVAEELLVAERLDLGARHGLDLGREERPARIEGHGLSRGQGV